jgi:ankyrin repeat protein
MALNYILLHAVKTSRIDVTQELIDKGADPNCVDPDQKTPLYYAYEFRQIQQIEILCKKSANVNKEYCGMTILQTETIKNKPNEDIMARIQI